VVTDFTWSIHTKHREIDTARHMAQARIAKILAEQEKEWCKPVENEFPGTFRKLLNLREKNDGGPVQSVNAGA
jgi:hypothetical protein